VVVGTTALPALADAWGWCNIEERCIVLNVVVMAVGVSGPVFAGETHRNDLRF